MIRTARLLVAMMVIGSTAAIAQPRIDLSEGTLTILGSVSLQYDLLGFDNLQHELQLSSDIGGGYFVFDNWLVGLSVPGKWHFYPNTSGEVGLKIFSNYFFNTDSVVFPYLGLTVTPGYGMAAKRFTLRTGIEAGLLVSLSESVALDFAFKPDLSIKLNERQNWKVSVPAGFFGIRAVF